MSLSENGSSYAYTQLPYMSNGFINTGAIRANRIATNQMYNPVPSTSTQQNLTNTSAINTRPVYRNPLTMFPASVQPTNSYHQQAIIAPTHQENFFPPSLYNPTFYNTNNQNHFY